MILNYNSTTYQLATKTTESGETWVVGDTGVKTLKIYFTGITAVNVDNYECIAIIERADGSLSNNILATPVSTGYYKIITNEWICGIEGTIKITVKLRQSDGVGGYNTTTFGLATIDIAEGNLPGDDTITDAQYQALLTALNAAAADGITNLNYELGIESMVLTDIDQVVTAGAYQFFYHDGGETFDKKALMIISERDGDFLDETLYEYNAIRVRTYDVENETWDAWTKFVISTYKGYIDGLLAGTQAVDAVKYDTATPATTLGIGETRWNATEKTLETKLTGNIVARHNRDLFVYCQNKEIVSLNPGTPVYISGSSGSDNIFYIKKADNNDYLKTSRCFGITSELITANNYGFVCIKGVVGYLNTNSFTVGDVVYLGSAGTLTNVRPTKNILALGVVLQKSIGVGSIAVNSVFFPRPEDLSTIDFTGLANGDAIIKTANGWANQPVYTKSEADSKFLIKAGDTMSGNIAMGTNKITGLGDGSSDQDAATIKNLSNHDASETAHTYIRTLIEALEHEIERLDGRGSSYGEIAYTTATLLALDVATRDTTITNAIIAGFGGAAYVPLSGHIVYDTGVGDGVGYHEWEYNGTNWVDNGMLGSGKASNDLFGFIKGDGTYLSIVSGLAQVLKSDYADKIGTSVGNYTYAQLVNAFADRYTKNETDALLDALKSAFGWEQSELHSRTYTSADTFPYGTNAEIIDYSELSLYDYVLITYVLDGEHFTQMIRVDANILANGILYKYENDGATNYVKLYMDSGKDYVLFDTNYNLTPSGSHTLKLQIDGIKIKPIDAGLVAFDGTGTNYVSAETDVESAIVVLDDELHDAWTEIGAIEGGTIVPAEAGKATYDANDDQIDTTYEKLANKTTTWQETPDDTHYPSEKLVDDRISPIEANVEVLQLDNATKSVRLATIEETLRKSMANEVTGTAKGTDNISLGKDVANAPLKVEVDGGLLYAPQLVTNGDFSDGTTGWVAQPDTFGFAVNNGIMQFERTGVESYIYNLMTISISKYYMIYRAKSPSNTFNMNLSGSYTLNHSGSDTFEIISQVVDVTSNLTTVRLQTGAAGVNYVDYAYLFNISTLISNKQYSPLFNTTFDLMSDANIKTQMDYWVNAGVLPNNNIMEVGLNKRIRSVGKNLFDETTFRYSPTLIEYADVDSRSVLKLYYDNTAIWKTIYTFSNVKSNTQYTLSFSYKKDSSSLGNSYLAIFYVDGTNSNVLLNSTSWTSVSITSTIAKTIQYIKVIQSSNNATTYIDRNTLQLELGSTATTYEPYVNTDMYLQANANGYKLPNLVKDTIEFRNGKYYYVQRVKKYTLVSGDITSLMTTPINVDYVCFKKNTDYKNYNIDSIAFGELIASNGFYANPLSGDSIAAIGMVGSGNALLFRVSVAKGTYADLASAQSALAGTDIYYQLATPIEIEIPIYGNLNGYANGTVYIDNAIQDADIYGTNATITNTDYPIKSLESVIKINADGSQTPLLASSGVVASGGLSFTHSGLTSGDKVLFSYIIDGDYFNSTSTITYYDNKVVVTDSVTSKVYKITPAIASGVLSWTLTEV